MAESLDVIQEKLKTLDENKKAVDGNFSLLPPGGWPKGKHSVTLFMNDRKIVTSSFTVA